MYKIINAYKILSIIVEPRIIDEWQGTLKSIIENQKFCRSQKSQNKVLVLLIGVG